MKIINDTDEVRVGNFIAERVIAILADGHKVLWLIPGGSSIPVAAEAAKVIVQQPHARLMVTLTDERYGAVGHADSNWQQLMATGFHLPQALLVPVLTGETRAQTTAVWSGHMERLIGEADYVLGFFGIGADGHIAGLLPHTPGLISNEFAISYEAEQFERISITHRVIGELDEAIGYTHGKNKWPALSRLSEDLPMGDHPVQLLKQVPEFTLFTDYRPS